jgi:hypothetical protein
MAATITWDLIRPADIKNTRYGMRLTRGLMVKGITIDIDPTYGTDPIVLLKCLAVPGFPQIGQGFPHTSFAYLTVSEQNLREVVRNDCAKFDIVYSGLDPSSDPVPTWVVQDGYTISHVQTNATSDGSEAITVWYKKGEDGTFGDAPTGAQENSVRVHKLVSDRIAKVIRVMPKDAWEAVKDAYRSRADTINTDNWNDGERGQWYFPGPETRTTNIGATVTVALPFYFRKVGWFGRAVWYNALGQHPVDSATESDVFAGGPPSEGTQTKGNGFTAVSVQDESIFGSVFDFPL